MHAALLSHHRSGSNFVSELLERHSLVSLINEPLSMHTSVFPDRDLVRWGGDEFAHADLSHAPLTRSYLEDLSSYLVTNDTPQVRMFKETLLFEKLPWVRTWIPDLTVILLVRDPRAVVNSILRRRMSGLWRYDVTVPRYASLYDDVPFDICADSELDLVVSSWQIRYYEAVRSLEPFHHVVVRLEDVLLCPDRPVELMSHLGLAVELGQLAFLEESQQADRGGCYSPYRSRDDVLFRWRRDLDRASVDRIEGRLAGEMRELGYA